MTEPVIIDSKKIEYEKIMSEADSTAKKLALSHNDTLKLALMTEEMLEMMHEIVDSFFGRFWFEGMDQTVSLHLQLLSRPLSKEQREQLIASSTSGKNEAAKGFKGKILSLIQSGSQKEGESLFKKSVDMLDGTVYEWNPVKGKMEDSRLKDLEHSILSNVADRIAVSIQEDKTEITVTKSFPL